MARVRRQRKLRRIVIRVAALVGLMCEPARAQIYEWLDDANDRHFANSLEQVPPDKRASVEVMMSDAPTREDSDVPPPNASAPSETDPRTNPTLQEDADSDPFASGWDAGFDAGWDAGLRALAEEQPVCPAESEVIVLESRPPVVVNVARYDPAGVYYRSPYGGTVTVPFDDGASRGLTRRQLIQGLRSMERGW